MADGLDFDALGNGQVPPVAGGSPANELDFDLLGAEAPQPVSPAGGLDFDTLIPNPNLDTPDVMTPGIYAQNVWKTLASGVEPVSRWYKNVGKGTIRTTGNVAAAVGNLGSNILPDMMTDAAPFLDDAMSLNRAAYGELRSIGAKIAGFGELKADPDGSWLTEDLPHAVGGAIPYLASGIVGGTAVATGVGMLDMGQSMYDDAIANGATEEDARLSALAGSAIGATEALPVGYLLQRINKLSGGSFYEIAKNLKGSGGAIKEAVKGFLLSGGTEAGQQVAQNWVASDLVGYDPTRTLSENAWDSFVTGGAVGSLLMGSVGALHSSERRQARDALAAQFESRMAENDPINVIAGEFSPTGNVLPLREGEQQVTGELQEAGRTAIANPPKEVSEDFVSKVAQTPITPTVNTEVYEKIFAPTWVDSKVEKAIFKVDETRVSVHDALDRTPVVMTEINPYKDQLSIVEGALDDLTIGEGIPEGWDPAGYKAHLLETQAALKKKTELSKIFAGHMKNYVAKFMEVLGDGSKAILGDMTGREQGIYQGVKTSRNGGPVHGLMVMYKEARKTNEGKTEPLLIIEMDFDKLATARLKEEQGKKGWYSTEETKAQRQAIFEVLNHELGHYLMIQQLGKIRQAGMQAGTTNNVNTEITAAIEADYQKWLGKMKNSQFYEYLEKVGSPNFQPSGDPNGFSSDIPKSKRDYLFSFDEYYAQQMARVATQGKLAKEGVITKYFAPALKQYQKIFEGLPHFAQQEYGTFEKFVQRFSLHHQISEEIQKATAGGPKTFYDALKGLPGFDPANFAGLRDEQDNWNKVMEYGYNILQIQRENPHIQGLREYVNFTRAWAAHSRAIDARATETLAEWRKLGKKQQQAVSDVLLEESEAKARLPANDLAKRLPDLEAQKVYAQIRADFDYVLNEMQGVSVEQVGKNFPDNELLQKTKKQEIELEFAKMKDKGYFPFMRFGKWTVTVRDPNGGLLSYEAFDTKKERDAAERVHKAENGGNRVSSSVMKQTQFVVQGLPAAMLRTMKEKIPGLSDEQRTAIDQQLQDMAPFQGLKKQFLRRKGTGGFSLDTMRSYANYMRMSAGHLSRVKYGDELMAAIKKVDDDAKTLSLLGREATSRQQIGNWMKGHHDYIMDPTSEWTGLRGAVFQWFLGFNIKSAFINLSQIPMITFPYLAARYGDVRAARELATANATAISYWKNRKKWTDAEPNSQRGRIVRLLEQGKKDGWLDQSLAMELAVASSEGNIQRNATAGLKRSWYKLSEWGAKPFAVAEKFNRTIAAIAAYNLAYQRSKSHTTAYNVARDAVDRTQYENSRWNRPRFMRGKVGTAFVFTSYVQNTLHFMLGGDRGASRSLLMLFLAAGLMGMPGAENAEDLIDFLATKGREALGVKDPKFDLRLELRELLQELHTNPDLLLHGAGKSSFGLGALGEMTGLPLPEFDLAGSLSMGRPLPLTGLLGDTRLDSSAAVIGKAATEAGGAGMAAFDSFLQGIWSRDPDQWKRAEKMMPVWMKNVSQSTRLLAREKETSASGDVIAEFDPQDPKELIEILGKSLGFTPTELSVGWERTIAEKEAVNYYRMRMEGVLKTHNWAFLQKDEEGIHEARQRIKEFNEQVPFPEMKVGSETIKNSLVSYIEARAMKEQGLENQKRYIRLRKSVEAAYAEPGTVDKAAIDPALMQPATN